MYEWIAFVIYKYLFYMCPLNNYVGRNNKGHTSVLYLRGLLEPESTLLLAYLLRGVHIVALAVAWWTFQHAARDLTVCQQPLQVQAMLALQERRRMSWRDLLSRARESHSYSTCTHFSEMACNHQQILQHWLRPFKDWNVLPTSPLFLIPLLVRRQF